MPEDAVKSSPLKKPIVVVLILALFVSFGIAKIWPITSGGWMLPVGWKEPASQTYDACSFEDYTKPNFNQKKCMPLCPDIRLTPEGFPFATKRQAGSCSSATNDLGRLMNLAVLYGLSFGILLLIKRVVRKIKRPAADE